MSSGDLGGVGEVEFWRAEAKRLAVENVVLQTRVDDLEGQVGALVEKVSVLARLAFGTSSEKAKQAPDGDGRPGRNTMRLRAALNAIQSGDAEDLYGWRRPV